MALEGALNFTLYFDVQFIAGSESRRLELDM